MTRFSAASVLDLSSIKIHNVREGHLWLSSWRGQIMRYHLLNILLCARHNAKDFTSTITCNPQYNPLNSYWYPHFTNKETEFRQLLQIHLVLSDFKAHALNHNANFLPNEECLPYPQGKSEWHCGRLRSLWVDIDELLWTSQTQLQGAKKCFKALIGQLVEDCAKDSFTFRQKKYD